MNHKLLLGLGVTVCAVGAGAYVSLTGSPGAKPSLTGDSPAPEARAFLESTDSSAGPRVAAGALSQPPVPNTSSAGPSAPAAHAPATPAQRNAALRVVEALMRGPTEAGCRASEDPLLNLAMDTDVDSPLWNWSLARMRDCLRAPTAYRAKSPLLAKLQDLFPDHPRVRELAGLQSYDQGRVADAAAELEEALAETGSFESWQTLADAKLSVAREAGSPEERAAALAAAEDAMRRALPLATPALRPYALHTMARVQLEQGNAPAAIEWADRALEAVRDGSGTYQAYMAAEMNLFAGQIYYRAGQQETGLAYMDQGVAMAGSDRQRSELQQLRDRFLQVHARG